VVHLVLEDSCQESLSLHLQGTTVLIQASNRDLQGTPDVPLDSRNRQTSFGSQFLLLAEEGQLRVDHANRSVPDIDHDDSLGDPHLRCCQPDSLGGVHGLQHVGQQSLDASVNLTDGAGLPAQDRVRNKLDLQGGQGLPASAFRALRSGFLFRLGLNLVFDDHLR